MRLDFCVACGNRDGELNYHHMFPRCLGGSDDEDNILTLCRPCHGRIHGVEWTTRHRDLIRIGQMRSRDIELEQRKGEWDQYLVRLGAELDSVPAPKAVIKLGGIGQIRKELKRRGIRFRRTDGMAVLQNKLQGSAGPLFQESVNAT